MEKIFFMKVNQISNLKSVLPKEFNFFELTYVQKLYLDQHGDSIV